MVCNSEAMEKHTATIYPKYRYETLIHHYSSQLPDVTGTISDGTVFRGTDSSGLNRCHEFGATNKSVPTVQEASHVVSDVADSPVDAVSLLVGVKDNNPKACSDQFLLRTSAIPAVVISQIAPFSDPEVGTRRENGHCL